MEWLYSKRLICVQDIKSKYAVVFQTSHFSHLWQKIYAEEKISCSFLQEISLPLCLDPTDCEVHSWAASSGLLHFCCLFFYLEVAATQSRRGREFQACGLIINTVKPGSMLRIRKEKPEGWLFPPVHRITPLGWLRPPKARAISTLPHGKLVGFLWMAPLGAGWAGCQRNQWSCFWFTRG